MIGDFPAAGFGSGDDEERRRVPSVPHSTGDGAAVREALERELTSVPFERLTAPEVTSLLTSRLVAWGLAQGWMVSREVPSRARRGAAERQHHGFLDVVLERWGRSPVVVEIDRGNKTWSMEKLTAEHEAGCVSIWVRWGRAVVNAPEGVEVVHLPVSTVRGSPRRYTSSQVK